MSNSAALALLGTNSGPSLEATEALVDSLPPSKRQHLEAILTDGFKPHTVGFSTGEDSRSQGSRGPFTSMPPPSSQAGSTVAMSSVSQHDMMVSSTNIPPDAVSLADKQHQYALSAFMNSLPSTAAAAAAANKAPETDSAHKKRKINESQADKTVKSKPDESVSPSRPLPRSPNRADDKVAADLTTPPRASAPAKPATSGSITSFFTKQTTTPSVAVCTNCAQLEKSVVHHREQLTREQSSREALEQAHKQEIESLKSEMSRVRGELDTCRQEAGERSKDEAGLQALLERVMRENAVFADLQRREQLLRDSHSLGRIIAIKDGMFVNEHWEDGISFHNLKQRQSDLKAQKEALEREKAEFARIKRQKSRKTNSAVEDDGFVRPMDPLDDEAAEQDEIFRLRAAHLKKEEKDIAELEQQLDVQRKLHIRFSKRMADEKLSAFAGHPVLHNRFLLMHLLGKGGFSEVYKAFDLRTKTFAACKIHQLNPSWTVQRKDSYVRHATREYNIHTSLSHPRVVKLIEVFPIDQNSFCTVLEYCEGEDLDTYLKMNQTVPEKEAHCIISQVFSGLKYLNDREQKIIHYDLKPGNIMYWQGEVKITDFGLSKIIENEQASLELTSQGAGTYWYLPPECFQIPPPPISSKVDVWSAGVILYQMLFGKRPFGDDLSQEKILSQKTILNATTVEFPAKPAVSDETKEFIRTCLRHNHRDRPDALEIMKHPYLKPSKAKA